MDFHAYGEPKSGKSYVSTGTWLIFDDYGPDLSDVFSLLQFTTVPHYVQMNQPPVGVRGHKKRPATEYHRANSTR